MRGRLARIAVFFVAAAALAACVAMFDANGSNLRVDPAGRAVLGSASPLPASEVSRTNDDKVGVRGLDRRPHCSFGWWAVLFALASAAAGFRRAFGGHPFAARFGRWFAVHAGRSPPGLSRLLTI